MIYCPRCATEADDGQYYCRKCGANLTLINKAVKLGDAIGRSGAGGALPKIKAVFDNMKLDHVSEEVGQNLDQMNREIEQSLKKVHTATIGAWANREPRTPEERKAQLLGQGIPGLLTGVAMMTAFYYLAGAIVLRIPPEAAARIPFEVEPVVRLIWLLGLLPALSGLGKVIAALVIRPSAAAPQQALPAEPQAPELSAAEPPSVVEGTTRNFDTSAQRVARDAGLRQ
jgi:hypothetical protein